MPYNNQSVSQLHIASRFKAAQGNKYNRARKMYRATELFSSHPGVPPHAQGTRSTQTQHPCALSMPASDWLCVTRVHCCFVRGRTPRASLVGHLHNQISKCCQNWLTSWLKSVSHVPITACRVCARRWMGSGCAPLEPDASRVAVTAATSSCKAIKYSDCKLHCLMQSAQAVWTA